jgi:hypothetical protein
LPPQKSPYNGTGFKEDRNSRENSVQIAFRIVYACAVAILVVLFVVLGTLTFYPEPDSPYEHDFLGGRPPMGVDSLYCDPGGSCYLDNALLTPEGEARLNEEQRAYVQESRDFQARLREYEDDRVDHSRNVFMAASILGAAAIVAGVSFFRRIEAMPLGLLLGGFGVVLFGWIQAGDEFNEMGTAPPFIAVSIGLAAVLVAGYYFLNVRREREA